MHQNELRSGAAGTGAHEQLVPSTCWYTNAVEGPGPRLPGYERRSAGGGPGWRVECHEVWHYDDNRKIQRLERLAALCPACHEVKRAGLASKRNRLSAVIAHLADVNGWSPEDARLYLEDVFETWPTAATSGRSAFRCREPPDELRPAVRSHYEHAHLSSRDRHP
jgi:hypothetical protein